MTRSRRLIAAARLASMARGGIHRDPDLRTRPARDDFWQPWQARHRRVQPEHTKGTIAQRKRKRERRKGSR